MQIRPANDQDSQNIKQLHLSAFTDEENDSVATLAVDLLSENSSPETFSLVAETDNTIVGHVAFSPVSQVETDKFQGYILAPLGVSPSFQNQRVGAKLIEAGIAELKTRGGDLVFVYGDPKYYNRFGFETEIAAQYTPPYPLQHPFGWQAMALAGQSTFASSGKLSCVRSLQDPQLW